jgi:hypothetical protein
MDCKYHPYDRLDYRVRSRAYRSYITMSIFRDIFKKSMYGQLLRPKQDWFVILAIAAALLVISIAWNLWLFDAVKGGAVLRNAPATPTTLSASEQTLGAVQQAFVARAQEETKYETGVYTFVDPSQ